MNRDRPQADSTLNGTLDVDPSLFFVRNPAHFGRPSPGITLPPTSAGASWSNSAC
jgi:hypothetical protein